MPFTITIEHHTDTFTLTSTATSHSAMSELCLSLSQGKGVDSVTLHQEGHTILDSWHQGQHTITLLPDPSPSKG